MKPGFQGASIALVVSCVLGSLSAGFAQPCEQEIILRDSIGADNELINGTRALYWISEPYSSSTCESNGPSLMFELTPAQDVLLSKLRIAFSNGSTFNWFDINFSYLGYSVDIWSDYSDAIACPNIGNIYNTWIAEEIGIFLEQHPWYPTWWDSCFLIEYEQTALVEVDLTSQGMILESGQTYVIGIQVTDSNGVGGTPYLLESMELGNTDYLWLPNWSALFATNDDLYYLCRQYDGRTSVEIKGLIYGIAGDVDGDLDVDIFDFALFAGCIAGPGQSNKGCDTDHFDRSDIDSDSDVDLIDFSKLQQNFGQSCL